MLFTGIKAYLMCPPKDRDKPTTVKPVFQEYSVIPTPKDIQLDQVTVCFRKDSRIGNGCIKEIIQLFF